MKKAPPTHSKDWKEGLEPQSIFHTHTHPHPPMQTVLLFPPNWDVSESNAQTFETETERSWKGPGLRRRDESQEARLKLVWGAGLPQIFHIAEEQMRRQQIWSY